MPELTKESVLADLQPIFQEVLDDPNVTVTLKSNASNTQNWDSIAHIELIELTKMKFGIRFALGELQELKDVEDLVNLIIKKKS